ncbi:hypothetical protein JD844_031936 [Phrynosoma platyrhinos]|uniref:Ubiquitin carboxyl-terminal hydrolase isozyme L3 n=1 Tax=Phrynosoma platyrhinos TaxID=52577 RepID=A0ABQ7T4S6_PHRPL|nr:hypothetical protein JD844_031936 [Phrynosoma platyrhinos]
MYETFRTEEENKIKSQGQEVKPAVYFMKQTISNACGTIGLIHAIANNRDKINFEEDSSLKKFLDDSVPMSPEERAKYLETYEAIRVTHESSAHEGQTEGNNVPIPHEGGPEATDLGRITSFHRGRAPSGHYKLPSEQAQLDRYKRRGVEPTPKNISSDNQKVWPTGHRLFTSPVNFKSSSSLLLSPSSSQSQFSHCKMKASPLRRSASLTLIRCDHVASAKATSPVKATSPPVCLQRWRPTIPLSSIGLHCAAPSIDEKVDLHFIALVNVGGILYELGKSNPERHDQIDAIEVCKKFMERDPDELRFNAIALAAA